MLYISGARLVADKQVRIASTKICGIELKKAIQVRYRLGRNGFPSRVLLGIIRSFMNIFFFLFSLIMLFILHFLFILEFLVNGLSLLFRKLFHSIFDRLNSIMFNCCISETFLFFLQIGFIVMSFCLFLFCDKLMFPHLEKVSNPIQVVAQLSCFFFLFKYKDIRLRHLCLFSFVLTLLSSLYLKGISWFILFFVFLFYLIIICFFPLDSDLALFLFFLQL